MTIAFCTYNFSTLAIGIRNFFYSARYFIVKTWPSAPGIKLIFGTVKSVSTLLTFINTFFMMIIIFSCFLDNPKWIAGYSDITVLHCHLAMLYKTKSIHSIMPYDFPADGNSCLAIDKLLEVAGGKKPTYNLPTHDLNLEGSANGMLVGGNISILTSLLGSQSELDTEGSILFIEEVGEPLYRLDRMMQTLKRSGKLSSLAGLIVGGMAKMNEEQEDYGLSAEEVIMDMISDVNYPVCFGFPAGHFPENHPLIIGGEVSLSVNKNSVKIIFK
jgi:muramoyltetrapeptide carboxypeptidase